MKFQKLFIVIIAISISSCVSQQSMFEKAKSENSVELYEKFLQKYPKNNLLQDAQRNIMRIKYEKAVSANSSELYKEFLINYPKSNYREDIENKLHKLSYQDYISASINIGSNKYKNVKIKNLILMRVVDKKTRSKQGYPVMSPRGSFLIENGKVKIDKSKKATILIISPSMGRISEK